MADEDVLSKYSDDAADARVRSNIESRIVQNSISSIPAFELMTNTQVVTVRKWVTLTYGISQKDFILNRYGLPFIPIPSPKKLNNSSQFRMIPKSLIHTPIVVHPIFWTEKEVLGNIPSDPESSEAQAWSIRMFAFLLLCGYYSDNYEVKDYLKTNGIDIFDDEGNVTEDMERSLRSYLDGFGVATAFDNVEYLNYDSIVVDPETKGLSSKKELFEYYASMMEDRCNEILTDEVDSVYTQLEQTLELATRFLFEDYGEGAPIFDFDARNSMWSNKYEDMYFGLRARYGEVAENNQYSQLLVEELREYTASIEEDVAAMNRIVTILIGPILSYNGNISEEDIAALQNYHKLATDTISRKEKYTTSIKDISLTPEVEFDDIDTDSEERNLRWKERSIDKLDKYLQERREAFEKAWDRLFLCFANFTQVVDGEPIYESARSAKWEIQTKSNSN